MVNFVFSHDGHFGFLGGGGSEADPPSSYGVRPFRYFPGEGRFRNTRTFEYRLLRDMLKALVAISAHLSGTPMHHWSEDPATAGVM